MTTYDDDVRLLNLRNEAYELMCVLFAAMLERPDAQRLARLRRLHALAEWRYWRRHERAYPPGNQTPKWFRKASNAGY